MSVTSRSSNIERFRRLTIESKKLQAEREANAQNTVNLDKSEVSSINSLEEVQSKVNHKELAEAVTDCLSQENVRPITLTGSMAKRRLSTSLKSSFKKTKSQKNTSKRTKDTRPSVSKRPNLSKLDEHKITKNAEWNNRDSMIHTIGISEPLELKERTGLTTVCSVRSRLEENSDWRPVRSATMKRRHRGMGGVNVCLDRAAYFGLIRIFKTQNEQVTNPLSHSKTDPPKTHPHFIPLRLLQRLHQNLQKISNFLL